LALAGFQLEWLDLKLQVAGFAGTKLERGKSDDARKRNRSRFSVAMTDLCVLLDSTPHHRFRRRSNRKPQYARTLERY